MDNEKLRNIIDNKIEEIEKEKKSEETNLNRSKYYYASDLETLGNILVCDSKIELLNELLDIMD